MGEFYYYMFSCVDISAHDALHVYSALNNRGKTQRREIVQYRFKLILNLSSTTSPPYREFIPLILAQFVDPPNWKYPVLSQECNV